MMQRDMRACVRARWYVFGWSSRQLGVASTVLRTTAPDWTYLSDVGVEGFRLNAKVRNHDDEVQIVVAVVVCLWLWHRVGSLSRIGSAVRGISFWNCQGCT